MPAFQPTIRLGSTTPQTDFAATEWLMEEVAAEFLDCFRYLFPDHVRIMPSGHCALSLKWAMEDDPHAKHPYASPITVRFEPELLDALRSANVDGRRRIFRCHDSAMRAGMVGYNPYAPIPQSRVIVLG